MDEISKKVYEILSTQGVAHTPEDAAKVAMTRDEIVSAIFPNVADTEEQ